MYKREKQVLIDGLNNQIQKCLKESSAIIAGGAITSVFTSSRINDYDIYFYDMASYVKTSAYLRDNENNKHGYELRVSTDNADSFHNKKENSIIQLIKMPHLFSNPLDIIKEFDFTVCMGAYSFLDNQFYLHKEFLKHNAQRRLIFNPQSKYPICALYRVRKYLKRNYTISGGEIVKIGLAINNLNLETYADLRNQLYGIDTLILQELTDLLMSDEYKDRKFDFLETIDLIDKYLENYEDILS